MRFLVVALVCFSFSIVGKESKLPNYLPEPIGDEIEIYSIARAWEIDPKRDYKDLKKSDLEKYDHGFILGQGKVKPSTNIIPILNAGFGEPEGIAACFEPRHSIQYSSKLGRVKVDICFKCRKTYAQINGWTRAFHHTESVLTRINEIYRLAGVRIPVKN